MAEGVDNPGGAPFAVTMTKAPPSTFRAGLGTALPLILGYVPIAFSFGVAATRAGLSQPEAFALSLIIFAGASQFLAIKLITAGAPLAVAALTLVAMNLRHVLYGPVLMKRVGDSDRLRLSWAWAFALTDEVFGAALGALARGRRFSEPFMFGLGGAAYAAWILGTVAGAYAGGGALDRWPALSAGLGFMLPALFLALLLSILKRAQLPVIAVAALATIAVTLASSATAGLLAGMTAGALAGVAGLGRNAG